MKIFTAEFVKSAVRSVDYPGGGKPEIAFLGRSNVGKSSVINTLLNRRRLAQTSRTPGKTRTLNFFSVNGKFLFVDLPGYGYARLPRKLQTSWRETIVSYLSRRDMLRGVVLLIDVRHPPSNLDRQMKHWLDHFSFPTVVVATKSDKVPAAEGRRQLTTIREELPVADKQEAFLFSARTGQGKERIWRILEEFISPVSSHV